MGHPPLCRNYISKKHRNISLRVAKRRFVEDWSTCRITEADAGPQSVRRRYLFVRLCAYSTIGSTGFVPLSEFSPGEGNRVRCHYETSVTTMARGQLPCVDSLETWGELSRDL